MFSAISRKGGSLFDLFGKNEFSQHKNKKQMLSNMTEMERTPEK